jgi:alkylation response protein AidB-like acyl-CoA dehydrogenase
MSTYQPTPLTVLSEDETMFAEMLREFAAAEIAPHMRTMDAEGRMLPDIISKLFALDVMGIEIPEDFGGAGQSFFLACLAVEIFAEVDPSVAVVVDVQNTLVANAFLRWGSDALKQKYLPLLANEKIGAYALSEAGSGSDAFALTTRATADGEYFLLNGSKLWITNGGEAEVFIVFANIAPEKGYKGITAFIVEKGYAGFTIGKKEDKLGIRASSTCELHFDNCKVAKENVLGEAGRGYKIAIETLNEGRIGIGAQMVGLAQGAFNAARSYACERHQFGKSISEFQAVQFQLAEAATQIEAARLLVYNAARLKDAGKPFIAEAAKAKLFASRTANQVAGDMLEIFGGYGFTKEYPAEKYYRDAKIGVIYEGTSNMQLQTIAKLLLGED